MHARATLACLSCPAQSGNNDQAFASMVRQQFKANMGEVDDEKVRSAAWAGMRVHAYACMIARTHVDGARPCIHRNHVTAHLHCRSSSRRRRESGGGGCIYGTPLGRAKCCTCALQQLSNTRPRDACVKR